MRRYLNWKSVLALVAVGIVVATLSYTSSLAQKLALQERKDMEQWAEAIKVLTNTSEDVDISFALYYVEQNTTIPVIQTDEGGNITGFTNLDTAGKRDQDAYLRRTMKEFAAQRSPILVDYGNGFTQVYYGESNLLQQLRQFPYVYLFVVFLFLAVVLIALRVSHKSVQNQVWVGLSKETAHQLGTPLSSIEGWVELLGLEMPEHEAIGEMRKDLERLKLVADRFGKVGSTPVLEAEDLRERLADMVAYMSKRAPAKVQITLVAPAETNPVLMNGPLFDWVVENLIRNALDAMNGVGKITVTLQEEGRSIFVDVADTGKGIPTRLIKKVFKPGFSTKKRGWGLGLTLSKRIMEHYHKGRLFVKESVAGKGTTFRILMRR